MIIFNLKYLEAAEVWEDHIYLKFTSGFSHGFLKNTATTRYMKNTEGRQPYLTSSFLEVIPEKSFEALSTYLMLQLVNEEDIKTEEAILLRHNKND